jgi:hypothetical protein
MLPRIFLTIGLLKTALALRASRAAVPFIALRVGAIDLNGRAIA